MTDVAERSGTEARLNVEQIADSFIRMMQTFSKARSRLLAAAAHDVEWSAHVILKTLRAEGPIRSGALAEVIQSDPSTVSRQVAALVKDGLLERRADPEDGRAALLVLTERAREVLAVQDRLRLDHYADMLVGWTDEDLAQFAELLRRFTETYENANEHWITERISRVAVRSEGSN
ncbi:MarR family winged helix-turn-helix transcriptional regulator [uncultured Jatrophihabitans sp.]|uniref:MarR family winged helix-turn-helix transcriptional regulator n=1 Tax=uncultured Jatrophihabitans sp. TaxID=1610747 RepID=UPI0035CAB6FC